MILSSDINLNTRQALFSIEKQRLVEISPINDFSGADIFFLLSLVKGDMISLLRFLFLKSAESYEDASDFVEDLNALQEVNADEDNSPDSTSLSGFVELPVFSESMGVSVYMEMVLRGFRACKEDSLGNMIDSTSLSVFPGVIESLIAKIADREKTVNNSNSNKKDTARFPLDPSSDAAEGLSLSSLLLIGVTTEGEHRSIEVASIEKGDDMSNYSSIFSIVPERVEVSEKKIRDILVSLSDSKTIRNIEVSFGESPAS